MTHEPDEKREQRQNLLLRMLINEMLDQVREMHRHSGPWPTEERATAEAALERIMTQVRAEAVRKSAE
jgi:hypothetical protein